MHTLALLGYEQHRYVLRLLCTCCSSCNLCHQLRYVLRVLTRCACYSPCHHCHPSRLLHMCIHSDMSHMTYWCVKRHRSNHLCINVSTSTEYFCSLNLKAVRNSMTPLVLDACDDDYVEVFTDGEWYGYLMSAFLRITGIYLRNSKILCSYSPFVFFIFIFARNLWLALQAFWCVNVSATVLVLKTNNVKESNIQFFVMPRWNAKVVSISSCKTSCLIHYAGGLCASLTLLISARHF
jgi:hypothetical protein